MYYQEINERLKQLKIEDFVWLIYIVIIGLSLYSNSLEKKYFLNNDNNSKEKYRHIMITIFVVLIIVYLYFLNSSINDINNLKKTDSKQKINLTYLSFIGSLLITISGFIFLYISLVDKNLEIELAFN